MERDDVGVNRRIASLCHVTAAARELPTGLRNGRF